jgi:hypothetical protein
MKILVTGDRHWSDNDVIRTALVTARVQAYMRGESLEIVHGNALGADRIAGQVAAHFDNQVMDNEVKVYAHPARWSDYGKAAGPIRNREMLSSHPDIELVLAFHADILHSKGTRDMVQEALHHNLPVFLFPNQDDLDKLKARRKQQALF